MTPGFLMWVEIWQLEIAFRLTKGCVHNSMHRWGFIPLFERFFQKIKIGQLLLECDRLFSRKIKLRDELDYIRLR
jgi:hypothetical protein